MRLWAHLPAVEAEGPVQLQDGGGQRPAQDAAQGGRRGDQGVGQAQLPLRVEQRQLEPHACRQVPPLIPATAQGVEHVCLQDTMPSRPSA